MRTLVALGLGGALSALGVGAVLAADDPQDMAVAAQKLAREGPRGLTARGPSSMPNYADARFRNVRANYKRFEIVNDRIVFCGEVNAKQVNGQMTGWTPFAYLPGSPPILVTTVPGLGLREVGPHVLRNVCQTGQENWLSEDFTGYFETKAAVPERGAGTAAAED